MVLLKKQEGFSIIETLVVITILGLLITFTTSFINKIYNNPVYLLKDEAFRAASNEIDGVMLNGTLTDTLYNIKHNLFVKRHSTELDKYYLVSVVVKKRRSNYPLLELKTIIKK